MKSSRRKFQRFARPHRIGRKTIANNRAPNRLCRVTTEPRDTVRPKPGLSEDIPDRFALAARARHWPYAAAIRQRFHKTTNTMLIRPLARRDRIPQHWR